MSCRPYIQYLPALFCCLALLIAIPVTVAADVTDGHMDLSNEELAEEDLVYENASVYDAVSRLEDAPLQLANEFPKTSYGEWSQGQCGNCWVWAGTGAVAQSQYKSTGTSTPLSIQFFNSNYMNGNINMEKPHDWACTGGFASTFAEIYTTGLNQSYPGGPFVVPWSNYNATYKDVNVPQNRSLQTSLPKNLMTTTPNIGLTRIDAERVLANPPSNRTAAIENITLALVDGKVIFYTMTWPNSTGLDDFNSFWYWQPDDLWEMDPFNQTFYNESPGESGGHAMILMGYNKTDPDPEKHYWIVQNSWGTSTNRTKGQYRLKMQMDYNATFNNTPWNTQEFWVFNVTWKTDPAISSITPSAGQNTGSVAITSLAGSKFSDGAEVMLKSGSPSPRHAGSLANGTGGATLEGPMNVKVVGNYAYIASYNNSALEIVNLTDPMLPVHESRIGSGDGGALLTNPMGVDVSGKYAYVASYNDNALEIVDISNPASPVHKGSIVNGTGGAQLQGPMNVKVVGNYAYVTSAVSNALEIVDISNPASPVHKANVSDGTQGGLALKNPFGVDIAPNYPYAYVTSTDSNTLTIIDISNSSNPYWESYMVNGGSVLMEGPRSVRVAGYNAFIASYASNALEIIDISNSSVPVHRGSLVRPAGASYLNGPYDLAISSDWKYAYVASYGGGTIDIIDISNPAAPVYVSSLADGTGGALLKQPRSVALSRSLAYVASEGQSALEVVALDGIPATGISVASSGKITSVFNLSGAPAGNWNVVVTNVNGRFATLSNGFSITSPPQPQRTPWPDSGGDSPSAGTSKTTAHAGPAGQASVSIRTNDLGQTIAPYSVQTTTASPIEVTVSIPQSTKSLTPDGRHLGEVMVTPVSQEAVAAITGTTATPSGAVFTAGGLGVECTPSGATFDHPVSVTFTMTEAQWAAALAQAGGKADSITVQYYDTTTKSWISLPTIPETATRSVTATTTHFTLFAVFIKTAAGSVPAQVTYSWETPAPAAAVHTAASPVATATPPAPIQPQPQFPLIMIGAVIAGIAILAGVILLLRRWWIRRQNPALFRKYD